MPSTSTKTSFHCSFIPSLMLVMSLQVSPLNSLTVLPYGEIKSVTDLRNVTLRIISHIDEGVTGSVDSDGRIVGDRIAEKIMRDLQSIAGFKVTLTVLRGGMDSTFPYYFTCGVGHNLVSGKADLGLGYFFLTRSRVETTSPLIPILSDGLFAHFQQPKVSSVRNIFVMPLSRESKLFIFSIVWAGVVAQLVFIIKIQGGGRWRCPAERQGRHAGRTTGFGIEDMIDSLLITVSILSNIDCNVETWVGSSSSRKSTKPRLLLPLFVLSFFIVSIYTCQLLVVLLLPEEPIKRVEDMLSNSPKYSFYVNPSAQEVVDKKLLKKSRGVNMTYLDSLLLSLKNPDPRHPHTHLDVGLKSINGFRWFKRIYELLNQSTTSIPEAEVCRLSSVEVLHSKIFLTTTFYIRKNSEYREALNRGLLKIRVSGLLRRYMTQTTASQIRCDKMEDSNQFVEDLGLKDVASAFFLLLYIYIGAISIFFLEKVWVYYKKAVGRARYFLPLQN